MGPVSISVEVQRNKDGDTPSNVRFLVSDNGISKIFPI